LPLFLSARIHAGHLAQVFLWKPDFYVNAGIFQYVTEYYEPDLHPTNSKTGRLAARPAHVRSGVKGHQG